MKKLMILICFLPSLALAQVPGVHMDEKGYYGNGSTQQQLLDQTRANIRQYEIETGYGVHRRPTETQRQYLLEAESNRITNRALVDGLSYDRAAAIERAIEGVRK